MTSRQAAARWMLDRLAFVCVGAPLIGLAFGALAGALEFGWWWALFLLMALVTSRPGFRWKVAVLLVLVLVSWRSSVRSSGEFDEKRTSRSAQGQLIVGKRLTNWSGEREGLFFEEGKDEIRVAIQDAEKLTAGDRLMVDVSMFRPSVARNPDEFSMLDVWRRNDLSHGVDLEVHQKVGFSWRRGLWKYAEQGRAFIKNKTRVGIEDSPDAIAVIHAMTLGETPAATSEITKAFRLSGAMHVFAVSGLHVTIVGGIVWCVLLIFRVQRRRSILAILLVMFGYALVTGGNPPAIRASLMAATVLSAFALRQRPSFFNSLALSMILVLIWNPTQVHEIGFQLSYAVISAIALGAKVAYELTGKIAQIDSFFPRRLLSVRQKLWLSFRGKIAVIMATSLAAWIGSLPWMLYHFGLVTPISVFASVILIPLTFLVLALSFFSSFLGLFSDALSSGVNHVNLLCAKSAYLSASGFSKVPLGHAVIRHREPSDWVVFDFADGGSASFLATGDGVLIDCGSDRQYRQIARSALRRWDWSPETVIFTHPDGKHSGALNQLERDHAPERILLPVIWSRSPSYREFVEREHFDERGIEVVSAGKRYEFSDDASLEVIREGMEEIDTLSDSRGAAYKVHWHGWKILVMGDLGVEEERDLIASGADLSADVVIVGQHGRTYSGSIEFLRATGAEVVIKSAATFPSKELPQKRWLNACEAYGIDVFNQRDSGAVLMDFEEDELILKSYLEKERVFILEKG